jgi:membrane protease subunit HflK
MAWNEPGKDDKDPWGNKQGGQDGPPDLDEVVKKMQDKLSSVFGGKKSGKSNGSDSGNAGGSTPNLFLPIVLLVLAWVAYNSVHIIDQAERGVVLRFGEYVATLDPGLNFRLPKPIETVYKVDVSQVLPITDQALMLTKDENIVDINMAVQYRVNEASDYLFNVDMPDFTLKQVAKTAVREVIGGSDMDFVLTEGRTKIETDTKQLMQTILDQYKVGLVIESVNMQSAKPPEEVRNAFDDAIKAREDKQRLINQAEAYRNEILPQARGEAARQTEDAMAYQTRVSEQATGEAQRFEQLLEAYLLAPKVTRERLYIDSMESVFHRNKKIFLDTGAGDKILYLPLDGTNAKTVPAPVYRSSSSAGDSLSDSATDRSSVSGESTDMRIRSER